MTSEGGVETGVAGTPPPPRPKIGRGTPTDWFLIGMIVATSLWHLAAQPLKVLWLKPHPYLLLALRPSVLSTLAAGALVRNGSMPLYVALLLPMPMFFLEDPFYFWAGRRYGQRLVALLAERDPAWEGRMAKAERVMKRNGALAILFANIPVQPIPTSMIYFVAGTTRMRLATFVIADLIGLQVWTAAEVWLGYALGEKAESVVDVITQYSGYLLTASFVVITWVVVRSAFRGVLEAQGKTPEQWRAERRSSKLQRTTTTTTRHVAAPVQGFLKDSPLAARTERRFLRLTVRDYLCLGPIVANGIMVIPGRALFYLWQTSHPVLLLAVRASIPTMVSAGVLVRDGSLSPWLAIILPIPYLFFDDLFYYWAGVRYGPALTNVLADVNSRWQGRVARAEHLVAKHGFWSIVVTSIPFIPVPVQATFFIAGDVRMRLRTFLIADLVGILLVEATFLGLGYALGDPAQDLVTALTSATAAVLVTIIGVGLLIVILFKRRRQARISLPE